MSSLPFDRKRKKIRFAEGKPASARAGDHREIPVLHYGPVPAVVFDYLEF